MGNERAAVFEGVLLGIETNPGTGVTPYIRLKSTKIMLDPKVPVTEFVASGSKVPTVGVDEKEITDGTFEGPISFYDMCYLATLSLCQPVITTPAGATNTRRWTWKPQTFFQDNFSTATLEKTSTVGIDRVVSAMLNSMQIQITPKETKVSGNLIAQDSQDDVTSLNSITSTILISNATGGTWTLTVNGKTTTALAYNITISALATALDALGNVGPGEAKITSSGAGHYAIVWRGRFLGTTPTVTVSGASLTGATPTITVTPSGSVTAIVDIEEKPASPKRAGVYLTDTYSNFTPTDQSDLLDYMLTRLLEYTFNMQDRCAGLMTVDPTTNSFSALIEKVVPFNCQIVISHDSTAYQNLRYLRNGDVVYIRALIEQGQIETGFPFRMMLTMPMQFKGNTRADKEELYCSTFSFFPIYDDTFGGWLELVIDNDMAALGDPGLGGTGGGQEQDGPEEVPPAAAFS